MRHYPDYCDANHDVPPTSWQGSGARGRRGRLLLPPFKFFCPLVPPDKLLEVNVKAAVSLVQAFAPLIPSGGSVLLVSSVTAFAPAAPVAMYAVSKTALLGLTKALAAELGSRSVRVNCLCPGIVPTKLSEALIADAGDRARLEQSTCLGRLGRPEEVAACAAFLCSDDASYVTGENLVVSGGMQSRL